MERPGAPLNLARPQYLRTKNKSEDAMTEDVKLKTGVMTALGLIDVATDYAPDAGTLHTFITLDGVAAPVIDGMETGDFRSKLSPFRLGQKVFLRKVTMIDTGVIVAVYDDYLVLVQAAWIADTGRYANAMKDGPTVFAEVEPYPAAKAIICALGDFVDGFHPDWDLPTKQL